LKLEEYFGNDQGVMLEWLNENYPPGGIDGSWRLWRDGGHVTYLDSPWYGLEFVGVNPMLSAMRAAGSKNAIIIQGIQRLFNCPTNVADPSNKLIYAAHPFFGDGSAERMDWDGTFGNFVSNKAFIVTAWNQSASADAGTWCPLWGVGKVDEFLDYLDVHDIGLMGYGLDVPYSMINHFTNRIVGVRHLGTDCAAGGVAGANMTNFIMSGNLIDRTPPTITGWRPSFTTNVAFYEWFNVSDDYSDCGYWTTNNGATWNSFTHYKADGTIMGAGIQFRRTTTLKVYGSDMFHNKSVTNTATYTIDTTPPVVWNWRPSFTTNVPFYEYFDISENYGYWSTNGSPWAQFDTNGVGWVFRATTTLQVLGCDAAGNVSETKTATYTILP
jgi:hypothetical protein